MINELVQFINNNCRNSVIVTYHQLFILVEFYSRQGKLLKSCRYGVSHRQKLVMQKDLSFYADHERLALEML